MGEDFEGRGVCISNVAGDGGGDEHVFDGIDEELFKFLVGGIVLFILIELDVVGLADGGDLGYYLAWGMMAFGPGLMRAIKGRLERVLETTGVVVRTKRPR